MPKIKILHRYIGDNEPCFIIAEAGVNHDCILERGYELIRTAKENGADAIKFQTYKTEKLTIKNSPKYWSDDKETQYENYKKLDYLSNNDFIKLQKYARKLGIISFSTPFDEESADFLEDIGVPMFKISSADIIHMHFLRHVARKKLPIILSTGASTIGEIEDAVKAIENEGNNKIMLLHCILSYPTPIKEMHLRMITTLKNIFPQYPIGLSDHSLGTVVPVAAVALGAKIIEKHYTIDKTIKGSSDHPISIDPKELREMVTNVRHIESALGYFMPKRPTKIEEPAARYARRSIVAKKNIKSGEILTTKNITAKRPGTGISPKFFYNFIGKKAARDIEEDEFLNWSHLQ